MSDHAAGRRAVLGVGLVSAALSSLRIDPFFPVFGHTSGGRRSWRDRHRGAPLSLQRFVQKTAQKMSRDVARVSAGELSSESSSDVLHSEHSQEGAQEGGDSGAKWGAN